MITFDFETRSTVDVKAVGAWRYAEDATTKPLCMAWALDNGPVEIWIPPYAWSCPRTLVGAIATKQIFEAHNAEFEKAIWRRIMVERYGWPDIPDAQWSCTAARSATMSLPRSLDKVGFELGLTHQKDATGKRVMMKLCKPRRATKYSDAPWHEAPEDFKTLYEYCKTDVIVERELAKTIRDLIPRERALWLLDQKINERGMRIDIDAVDKALAICAELKSDLDDELLSLTDQQVRTATEVKRLTKYIRSVFEIALPSLDKAAVAELLAQDINPDLRRILEIRQAASKTSLAKYQTIQKAICKDGRLKGQFLYHGAITGRWSGKLMQPQNLPRNTFTGHLEDPAEILARTSAYYTILKRDPFEDFRWFFPNVGGVLSSNIRSLIIPAEGKRFFGGDYSSIEPRMVMWLSGEDRALEMYRQGVDRYVLLASQVYGIATELVTQIQRSVGKAGELGCIYKLAWKKLQATVLSQTGIELQEDFCRRVVATFRSSHPKLVRFWQALEDAARAAILSGKTIRTDYRGIKFGMHKGSLVCLLPSGRAMFYPQARVGPWEAPWGVVDNAIIYKTTNSVTQQYQETSTHGGKLCENVTSGLSRDVLAECMPEVEAAGYEIVLHAHDELLTEHQNGSVDEFQKLMARIPEWAPELPVKVSAWSGERYLK